MIYKCPYCLYSFSKEAVLSERLPDGIVMNNCPNPAVIEIGSNKKLCGKRLPLNFLESESIVLALTGASYVGKTYYYIALLDQLKNNKSLHRLGIHGDIVGSKEDKKKINSFFEDIRKNRRLIATTSIESALKSVIHLTISKRNKTKHVYLSLFDNPGERSTDYDYLVENSSNVYKADGLMFLIEPKQIEKLWKEILKHNAYLHNEDSAEDLYSVLNSQIELIKHARRSDTIEDPPTRQITNNGKWEKAKAKFSNMVDWYQSNQKVKIPIALAISKFDQLKKSIHVTIPFDETQFEIMCIRNEGFNEELINAISSEIEELITGLPDGEIGIKTLLRNGVKDHKYFGVKSIDVNEKGEPIDLNPQGVLLPLIWMLIKLELF